MQFLIRICNKNEWNSEGARNQHFWSAGKRRLQESSPKPKNAIYDKEYGRTDNSEITSKSVDEFEIRSEEEV